MSAKDPTSHEPRLRPALLGVAIAAACVPGMAQGQQQPPEQAPAADEEMVVVGQTAQIRRALDDQRASDNLKSIIKSDGINALPDSNAAESLQRLPGISIERDQGEGRFVRIRGTAPNLNNTTIDGVRVPAPEDDQRAVALDVLPSDLIESLVVTKALTPDMDADAVGGSVDVRSVSALDKDGPFFKISGRAGYNTLVEETSPKVAISGGRTFEVGGGRLGVAAALSYEDRDFGSDNVETGGGWNFEGAEPGLEELEQRDYTINRERTGAALNLDYEQNENNRYYLRTMYSEFTDDEQRNANIYEFASPLADGGTSAPDEPVGLERELKDRVETQEILSAKIGAEHFFNQWTLEYEASASEASEKEGQDQLALGEAIFIPENDITGITLNATKRPRLSGTGVGSNGNFEFDGAELEKGEVTDEEVGASFDLKRDFMVETHPASVKFGAKATRRTKERDLELYAIGVGDVSGDPGLENYSGGTADWPFGEFGSEMQPGPVRDLLATAGDPKQYRDLEASEAEDFKIDEDINAAYVMGTIDIDALRLTGGVRYEGTSTEGVGSRYEGGSLEPSTSSNDYSNVLPSLHARYELSDRTLIRSSVFQSIARPVFEQISPGIIIDRGDPGIEDNEVAFGNPNLDELQATNLDLGIEHYMGSSSAVSAHLFYKDIDNFIFETDLAGTGQTRRGLDMDNFPGGAETFENGEGGEVTGLELAGSHRFYGLPGIWSNLLVDGNVTLANSDATISGFNPDKDRFEKREIDLPRQSDVTSNLSLGYEGESFSMRLAGSYKSEYLAETGNALESTGDIYESDHFQLDFSGSYNLTNELKMTFEVVNINDRPFYTYQDKESFNAQHEEYGRTYRLGLTYASF
ncbi:TonB-dependent receptor [Salicola sp. Rm-C-2C1-2]|uniref:TonB-dependent receptor n=1 Tax=Salicola sp. Rm-C-2C1-2 TaxID=3141321 RepID=UPI0032E4A5F9